MNWSSLASIDQIEWKYLSYGKMVGALRVADIVSRHCPAEATVFDLGCGGGGLSHFFPRYVGVDYAPKALAVARRLNPQARFVCGDAQHLPLADQVADVAVSISMLEHTPDPAAGLREIARVCRGKAVLILPCADTFGFFYDPVNWLRVRLGLPRANHGAFGYGHINVLTRAGWMELIEASGFRIEAVEGYDDSLLGQLEFAAFSMASSGKEYHELTIKPLSGRLLSVAKRIHRLLSLIDLRTRASFCQTFVCTRT